MKIAVLLGDGMADVPLDELDGCTPLQVASTPHLDALARDGVLGTASTVPVPYMPASSPGANPSTRSRSWMSRTGSPSSPCR